MSDTSFPPPSVAAIGTDVIVPVTAGSTDELACFDAATSSPCAGSWPIPLGFSYDATYGAPFPFLSPTAVLSGFCLPSPGDPCFDFSGASVATPAGMAAAIPTNIGWNGPAFVLGPRVYVPNGSSDSVTCYDASTESSCANFPKALSSLGLLYTVNADPARPTCIWVNSDNGSSQIQNFDAYTGGPCGEGAIRVLASSFVVNSSLCVPTSYSSLQVQQPPPTSYSSGTVVFEDADANPIAGVPTEPLDATGTVDLAGLDLSTAFGLPQFLITLLGAQGTPASVVVELTWTGVNDPSCVPGGSGQSSACQRQYVFVHGIHGNFAKIASAINDPHAGDPNFASLLYSLHEQCPSEQNVHIFAYYHDIGDAYSGTFTCKPGTTPADTHVGLLYLDPGSTGGNTCDGNGPLALDATALDQYLTVIASSHPGAAITILANSMGGAVTRGWLLLAQDNSPSDPTLSAVDSVIFLEGAQQGSIWAGVLESIWAGTAGSPERTLWDLFLHTPLASPIKALNLNPNDPGIIDLAPQSAWYNSVNLVPPPSGIAYFNFAGNIHITLNVNYFFGQSQIASVGLGDYMMLPGNSNPTAEPLLGGEDFLPGGRNIPNIHQFLLDDAHKATYKIVVGPIQAVVAGSLITAGSALGGPLGATLGGAVAIATFMPWDAVHDPTDHFNLPSNMGNGKVFVHDCNARGTERPTKAILGIVANPEDACP